MWDATCPNTLAPSHSHIALASREPGLLAEHDKAAAKTKYVDLLTTHHFVPISIEITGVFGTKALSFFKEIGCRLIARSSESLSFSHLLQQIGVTIQRGNIAAVVSTYE